MQLSRGYAGLSGTGLKSADGPKPLASTLTVVLAAFTVQLPILLYHRLYGINDLPFLVLIPTGVAFVLTSSWMHLVAESRYRRKGIIKRTGFLKGLLGFFKSISSPSTASLLLVLLSFSTSYLLFFSLSAPEMLSLYRAIYDVTPTLVKAPLLLFHSFIRPLMDMEALWKYVFALNFSAAFSALVSLVTADKS